MATLAASRSTGLGSALLLLLVGCTGSSGAVGIDPGAGLPCSSDAQCGPAARLCGPAGVCVECVDDSACLAFCVDGRCAECASDADCADDEPRCAGGSCVACRGDADCEAEEPICAPDGDCLPPCPADGCEGGEVCHPSIGACVECAADTDCPAEAPRCDPQEVECVECVLAADCGGEDPFCNAGDCVQCLRDSDCGGGLGCSVSFECE